MAKKAIEKNTDSKSLEIVFTGDFRQTASDELKAGAAVTILFDPARLPFERSEDKKGKPEWTISAFYQASPDGGITEITLAPEKSRKKVADSAESVLKGSFTIPEGSEEAIIWFLNTGASGKLYFDSDFGKNYRFPVSSEVAVPTAPAKRTRAKKSA